LGAAILVYHHDMYDREPRWLLAVTVGLGAGAMALAGRVEALTLAGGRLTSSGAIAAIAASEEQVLGLAVVVTIALLARRAFNDPMDGLTYGSMVGLGMALEESVAYLRTAPRTNLLPPAELVRICGHLVMNGIAAFPLGPLAVHCRGGHVALVACLGAAIALHFGWDWIALDVEARGAPDVAHAAAGMLLMSSGLLLYGALTAAAARWSHDLFAPKSPFALWGWPFDRRRP
jgi:RsiW-degrading membrane proteinase PrsW (M82 family)